MCLGCRMSADQSPPPPLTPPGSNESRVLGWVGVILAVPSFSLAIIQFRREASVNVVLACAAAFPVFIAWLASRQRRAWRYAGSIATSVVLLVGAVVVPKPSSTVAPAGLGLSPSPSSSVGPSASPSGSPTPTSGSSGGAKPGNPPGPVPTTTSPPASNNSIDVSFKPIVLLASGLAPRCARYVIQGKHLAGYRLLIFDRGVSGPGGDPGGEGYGLHELPTEIPDGWQTQEMDHGAVYTEVAAALVTDETYQFLMSIFLVDGQGAPLAGSWHSKNLPPSIAHRSEVLHIDLNSQPCP